MLPIMYCKCKRVKEELVGVTLLDKPLYVGSILTMLICGDYKRFGLSFPLINKNSLKTL